MIKRGAESCLVAIGDDALIDIPAVRIDPARIIDTTAAGDSFSAGYLSQRLTGGSPQASSELGHLTASTVIQHRGAIIPLAAMPQ